MTSPAFRASSRKVVPFARLQQIDVHQKLFDQIIGTATLRMETAGTGADAKVHLGLLTTADAQGLRAFALTRRAALQGGGETAAIGAAAGVDAGEASEAAPPAPAAATAERVLLQIGPGRLAVAAVSGLATFGALSATGLIAGAAAHDFEAQQAGADATESTSDSSTATEAQG